jgi:CTP:molybdopterin cytidylyltransferase MocA
MGRPKPLLDFDGRTCLDLVLDALREAGCAPLVAVLGAEADRVRAGCRLGPDVTIVVNPAPERGQTSSVKAGLAAVPRDAAAIFVHPADHPLLEAETVRAIASRFREAAPGWTLAVPVHGGRRGHPLLMAAAHGAGVLKLPDGAPLHDYVRAREAELLLVPVEGAGAVTGMNTEEEYQAALAAYRRRA